MTHVCIPAKPAQIAAVARQLRGPLDNEATTKLNDIMAEQGFPRPDAKRFDRRGDAQRHQHSRRDFILQALVG